MTTLVTLLLDKSGSMEAAKPATLEALNAYINGLKGQDISFSLIQFDTFSTLITYKNVAIGEVQPLGDADYKPMGGTPLLDACMAAISATEERLAQLANAAPAAAAPKVVMCFQTDGLENASRRHSWDDLNAEIKNRIEAGWEFKFMGVGFDAYAQATRLGVAAQDTMAYDANDGVAMHAAFAASAFNTAAYASGEVSSTAYSLKQKQASGDPTVTPTPK